MDKKKINLATALGFAHAMGAMPERQKSTHEFGEFYFKLKDAQRLRRLAKRKRKIERLKGVKK
jgi:hypothetical protein